MSLNDLIKLEDSLEAKFRKLSEWEHFAKMDKQLLSSVLLKNYSYGRNYKKIISIARKTSKQPESHRALNHIIEDEGIPKDHVVLHGEMLTFLGIDLEQADAYERLPSIKRLIDTSFAKAKCDSLADELEMLTFLRLGAETLAGQFYQTMLPLVADTFAVEEKQLKFISIHAAHDLNTSELGMIPSQLVADNKNAHADVFNTPIVHLMKKVGEEGEAIVKNGMLLAYSTRREYLTELARL